MPRERSEQWQVIKCTSLYKHCGHGACKRPQFSPVKPFNQKHRQSALRMLSIKFLKVRRRRPMLSSEHRERTSSPSSGSHGPLEPEPKDPLRLRATWQNSGGFSSKNLKTFLHASIFASRWLFFNSLQNSFPTAGIFAMAQIIGGCRLISQRIAGVPGGISFEYACCKRFCKRITAVFSSASSFMSLSGVSCCIQFFGASGISFAMSMSGFGSNTSP
mmetsp:Transcript_83449/g.131838  ORF Transcript_83449/g.131838 Transcript_83449/m.131838 type:complete len:217 (+) Transcript_83449:89-739(+)